MNNRNGFILGIVFLALGLFCRLGSHYYVTQSFRGVTGGGPFGLISDMPMVNVISEIGWVFIILGAIFMSIAFAAEQFRR